MSFAVTSPMISLHELNASISPKEYATMCLQKGVSFVLHVHHTVFHAPTVMGTDARDQLVIVRNH